MENMERRVFSERPEDVESEKDPLQEKVSTWIESYAAERASREAAVYEMPVEVEEWFGQYQARVDALESSNLGREEWKEEVNNIEAEYEEKIQRPEYKLFKLRQDPDTDERLIQRLERNLLSAQEEARWEQNTENIPPRNILTNFEETATAMADIEGLGWANSQDRDEFSLLGTLRTFEKNKEYMCEDQFAYEIYGSGGINRWFIYGDGRVKFSEDHGYDKFLSTEELAKKIARRGFQIH